MASVFISSEETVRTKFSSEETVRTKYGYARPLLSEGLKLEGDTMGTFEPSATCAAVSDADEQPAPMIALTPDPWKTYCVSCSVACSADVESHLESL